MASHLSGEVSKVSQEGTNAEGEGLRGEDSEVPDVDVSPEGTPSGSSVSQAELFLLVHTKHPGKAKTVARSFHLSPAEMHSSSKDRNDFPVCAEIHSRALGCKLSKCFRIFSVDMSCFEAVVMKMMTCEKKKKNLWDLRYVLKPTAALVDPG
ncbi:hypothetical protein BaRGS_00012551 [Batillaria attramentaria]|uniref:Uncharacterized protein n=1 Tax=Batillaria attramentaria TaxID=370345 RepID=A0ABD0LA22_9CAEN